MLYIKTRLKNIQSNKFIDDPEAYYVLYKPSILKHPLLSSILLAVDKSTLIDGEVIETKFGITNLDIISTGAKALLISLCTDSYVDFTEAGLNVLAVALEISKEYDIYFYTENHLISNSDIPVILDGKEIRASELYDYTCWAAVSER